MTPLTLVVFILASAGLTHIIVDSDIMESLRNICPKKIKKLLTCHQCTGFWSGMLVSVGAFNSFDPIIIFLSGLMGSYIGMFSDTILDKMESN